MHRLILALAALLLAPSAHAQAAPVTVGDRVNYWPQGSEYLAYASSFPTDKTLKRGAAFDQSITIADPASWSIAPRDVTLAWHWPLAQQSGGKNYAYVHLAHGNAMGTMARKRVAPIRIRDLKTYREEFNWTPSIATGDYNLLSESWLTEKAGDFTTSKLEFGVVLYASAPAARFFDSGKQLGIYTDAYKRSWKVAQSGIYVTFRPATEVRVSVGYFDRLPALRWLQGKGLVDPAWYVNGTLFGVEPINGAGTVAVNRWAVTLR